MLMGNKRKRTDTCAIAFCLERLTWCKEPNRLAKDMGSSGDAH